MAVHTTKHVITTKGRRRPKVKGLTSPKPTPCKKTIGLVSDSSCCDDSSADSCIRLGLESDPRGPEVGKRTQYDMPCNTSNQWSAVRQMQPASGCCHCALIHSLRCPCFQHFHRGREGGRGGGARSDLMKAKPTVCQAICYMNGSQHVPTHWSQRCLCSGSARPRMGMQQKFRMGINHARGVEQQNLPP